MREWFNEFKGSLKEQSASVCSFLLILMFLAFLSTVFACCFGIKIYNFYEKFFIVFSHNSSLTSEETFQLNALTQKGIVLSASDFYTNMLSYYDGLISILVALLGVFMVCFWAVNRIKLRNTLDELVTNHLDHQNHRRLLKELLEEVFARNIQTVFRDQGLGDQLRNEITQLVIDDLEKAQKKDNEILTLGGE